MDPTASITLIDSDLTILSDFTQNLDTTKFLVAGMYDIPIYTITMNVFEDITDSSLEFESPDGFFNETSQGIAKLSLYLDLGTENEVCSQDVFLGSTNTFTDSNTKAVVSGISIPSGAPQRLLVAFELGQRS